MKRTAAVVTLLAAGSSPHTAASTTSVSSSASTTTMALAFTSTPMVLRPRALVSRSSHYGGSKRMFPGVRQARAISSTFRTRAATTRHAKDDSNNNNDDDSKALYSGNFQPSAASPQMKTTFRRSLQSPNIESGQPPRDRPHPPQRSSGTDSGYFQEGTGGERWRSPQSREEELTRRGSAGASGTRMGATQPATEYDWRQSVFEFQSLNDPKSNLSARSSNRRSDPTTQPDGEHPPHRSYRHPARSVTTHQSASGASNPNPPPTFTDASAPPLPTAGPFWSSVAAEMEDKKNRTPEWFQFREKEALQKTEVDEEVKRLRGPRVVTAELATQLGLSASVSYDEIRKAYRAEIKRCHPDAASLESNELRVRALENRFLRLTAAWEKFVETHKRAATFSGGPCDEEFAEEPAPDSTSRYRTDDGSGEAVDTSSLEYVARTRYVVRNEEDSEDVIRARSADAAAAVAAVNMGRDIAPKTKASTAPDSGVADDFLDTGSGSC